MAKRTIPLNDTQIKKSKPKDKGYKLFDGDGLFMFISTSGGKLWRLKYVSPVSKKEKFYYARSYLTIPFLLNRERNNYSETSSFLGTNPELSPCTSL